MKLIDAFQGLWWNNEIDRYVDANVVERYCELIYDSLNNTGYRLNF